MTRVGTVIEEAKVRRFLRTEVDGYPHPLAWDALRRYACLLTGGCSWGKPYDDALFQKRVVRCWKCHNTWWNWDSFQDASPLGRNEESA